MAAFLVAGGAAAAMQGGHGGSKLVVTSVCFALLVVPYMALCFTSFARDVRRWATSDRCAPVKLALGLIGLYLIYAVGTDCFAWEAFGRLSAFVMVPAALVTTKQTWAAALAVVAIWIPFDTGLLKSIWAWPAGEGAYVFNTALAVVLAVALFAGYRREDGLNTRFTWRARDLKVAALGLVGFLLIALPFGFVTDFITFNPKIEPVMLIVRPLGILFFIAIPEELLFRGLVQNLLEKKLGKPLVALAIASVFFGLTHYNNGPVELRPDWRYIVLATIAGGFYGGTYIRTRTLFAPALVHAAVDTIWVLFLMKGPP